MPPTGTKILIGFTVISLALISGFFFFGSKIGISGQARMQIPQTKIVPIFPASEDAGDNLWGVKTSPSETGSLFPESNNHNNNPVPVNNLPVIEILEPITTPILEPVMEPIIEPVIEPVIEPIITPIIEPVAEPITQPVVAPTPTFQSDKEKVSSLFQTRLEAQKNCDIALSNSLLTNLSKTIVNSNCSNMARERTCYVGKDYEILTKSNTATLYFPPFSADGLWPYFFAKENGEWKIDIYKMAYSVVMRGGGCTTGWGWISHEAEDFFCDFFSPGQCPSWGFKMEEIGDTVF